MTPQKKAYEVWRPLSLLGNKTKTKLIKQASYY